MQIFPTPTVSVTGGMTIDYESSQADVELTTDVNDVPLDWQYDYVIDL